MDGWKVYINPECFVFSAFSTHQETLETLILPQLNQFQFKFYTKNIYIHFFSISPIYVVVFLVCWIVIQG